jgi:4-hydroxythreonine-4-phosphate dehydrogenase
MASTKRAARRPVLAITMGDFNGTGPEVLLKSLRSPAVRALCRPLVVGSLDVLEYYARTLRIGVTLREVGSLPAGDGPGIPVLPILPYRLPRISPGMISAEAGRYSGLAIEEAVRLCRAGFADAIVTAPVSKEAMHMGGYKVPGQTEMLLRLSGGRRVAMILAAGDFRVGLATVHHPLKDVARRLTRPVLLEKLDIVNTALRVDFGIRAPRIAVLGLNPHAGEHGILGSEEADVIRPALAAARRRGIDADGPFPADAFFGLQSHRSYDAVLAMYHDQGLIPLKMAGFRIGVNISAGLPIIRTSPDHGTAFDIAGKGTADPESMTQAIRLAVLIARNRAAAGRSRAR